jgi:hypothetical protein
VKVTLGAGTIGRVVVTSGLAPGDHIALRDTARSADEMLDAPGAPAKAASTTPRRPGRP